MQRFGLGFKWYDAYWRYNNNMTSERQRFQFYSNTTKSQRHHFVLWRILICVIFYLMPFTVQWFIVITQHARYAKITRFFFLLLFMWISKYRNATLAIICWNGLKVVNNHFYINITFFLFFFLTHNIPLQPIIIKVTSKLFFFSFLVKLIIIIRTP